MNEVKTTIANAVSELFNIDIEPELGRSEEQFGDYATNAALQLAPKLGKTPREIADALASKINGYGYYQKVEVAGPGFLNITLKTADIWNMAANATQLAKLLGGQEILVEFGDPNPFKEMHIGHLYSYIVGDSICRLFETSGATVKRLSYHGDVGLHVAKAIYAIRKADINMDDASSLNMGSYYAQGAKAYEEDQTARPEIDRINEQIYSRADESINRIYDWGREQSFKYFDQILQQLGIKNDKRYLESQSATTGLEFVRSNIGTVFKESDGAVIYEGEKVGLHTRVFITSKGLPTYEAKDLGLAELKNQDYPSAVRSIIITAHEQSEYFKVMLAALAEFDKPLADKTTHMSHGFLSLSTGKMSSRSGNVYGATDLLDDVKQTAKKLYPNSEDKMPLAAVKYGFLKHRLGTDIIYDVDESVSIEGNSGPYLQYAYARANGILQKSTSVAAAVDLDENERSLARKISEYPEVIQKATAELMPHFVCTYIYELAQEFNRFYEHNRVIGDSREATRIALVKAYAETLKHGLGLLNIEAPERI